MPKYKMIDLFSGIGGIRLGFDKIFGKNAETVFASEIDYYARLMYENNFFDDLEIYGDIVEVDEKKFLSMRQDFFLFTKLFKAGRMKKIFGGNYFE